MNVSPKIESPDANTAKDPKKVKSPAIVIGVIVVAVLAVGGLGFVLVQNGVIPLGKSSSTDVAATPTGPAQAPGGVNAPGTGHRPSPSAVAMSKPGHPGMPGTNPAGLAAMKKKAMVKHAPKAAVHPPIKVASAMGGAPGLSKTAAAGLIIYPHVGVRPDPFAPYANIALKKWQIAHSFTPDYVPNVQYNGSGIGGPLPTPNGLQGNRYPGQLGDSQSSSGPTRVASASIIIPWKVAGIMTGAGVKAILINGEQSAIVQPGDDLPDDLAKVIKITASTVVVRPVADASQEIVLDTNTAASSGNSPYGNNNKNYNNGGYGNMMPPNMNRGMQQMPNNRFNPTQNRYNMPNSTQAGMD